MHWYRSADGEQRIWFDDDEIERIAEDELRRANMQPTPDDSIVDIEAFIERYLKATLDQYAELKESDLGLTVFEPGVPPAVQINRDLTGSAMDAEWCPPGIKGRWRATLAHEAAHILLHRMLYEFDPGQATLFDDQAGSSSKTQRCLKRDVAYRGRGSDWREVQANKGMAALLMPRSLFLVVARAEVQDSTEAAIEAAARRLAARFSVSREATAIRLATLGFRAADGGEVTMPAF